jgi:hypothetical protein
VARHLLRNDDGGNLVQLQPAESPGDVRSGKTNVRGFPQKLPQHSRRLVFNLLRARDYFLSDELLRGLGNQPVLVGDVFRREYISR